MTRALIDSRDEAAINAQIGPSDEAGKRAGQKSDGVGDLFDTPHPPGRSLDNFLREFFLDYLPIIAPTVGFGLRTVEITRAVPRPGE